MRVCQHQLSFLLLSKRECICSRLRPDVRDRQMSDVRQYHCLMPPPRGRGHKEANESPGVSLRIIILHENRRKRDLGTKHETSKVKVNSLSMNTTNVNNVQKSTHCKTVCYSMQLVTHFLVTRQAKARVFTYTHVQ